MSMRLVFSAAICVTSIFNVYAAGSAESAPDPCLSPVVSYCEQNCDVCKEPCLIETPSIGNGFAFSTDAACTEAKDQSGAGCADTCSKCVAYMPCFNGQGEVEAMESRARRGAESSSSSTSTTSTAGPALVSWDTMDGCCRAKDGKKKFNPTYTSSQDFKRGVSTAEATTSCIETCYLDDECTAIEVSTIKRKKTARCEFHNSNQISSTTRSTKSCKKAECIVKTEYVAPTVAPTSAPTATPTAAPTAPPTASPTAVPTATPTASPTATPTASPTAAPTATPTWIEKKGCCQARKKRKTTKARGTTVTIDQNSATAAAAACKQQCTEDTDCTAAEFKFKKEKSKKSKKSKKNKKNKKKTLVYVCELHTATGLNSASRSNKSCKQATCSIKA